MGWWNGRFVSTFRLSLAFCAIVVASSICARFGSTPTELFLLVSLHTYTSFSLALSYGYLSLPNRVRFLTFTRTKQVAAVKSAAIDPLDEAEAISRVRLESQHITVLPEHGVLSARPRCALPQVGQ